MSNRILSCIFEIVIKKSLVEAFVRMSYPIFLLALISSSPMVPPLLSSNPQQPSCVPHHSSPLSLGKQNINKVNELCDIYFDMFISIIYINCFYKTKN